MGIKGVGVSPIAASYFLSQDERVQRGASQQALPDDFVPANTGRSWTKFAGTAGSAGPTEVGGAETKPSFEAAQAKLDGLLDGTGTYTVLGDTNHSDPKLRDFMASDGTMEVLANRGVKHIAMEIRQEFQPLADKVASGELSPEEFSRKAAEEYWKADPNLKAVVQPDMFVNEGNVIRAAKAKGIDVMCVEGQSDLKGHAQHVLEVGQLESKFQTAAAKSLRDPKAAPSEELKAEYAKMSRERSQGDQKLAEEIKARSKGEKTVVFYGSGHGAFGCDLDEKLGNAKRIDLTADQSSGARAIWLNRTIGGDSPNAMLTLDGKVLDRATIDQMASRYPRLIGPDAVSLCPN